MKALLARGRFTYKGYPTRCRDCSCFVTQYPLRRRSWEWYMVRHEVWAATGLERNAGCLCIGCLEQRLGRRLRRDDFSSAPVNRRVRKLDTLRLRARMLNL